MFRDKASILMEAKSKRKPTLQLTLSDLGMFRLNKK